MIGWGKMGVRAVTRIGVDVTFLEMDSAPQGEPRTFPEEFWLSRLPSMDVDWYLALYRAVGAPYCWWMRFELPRDELQRFLNDPLVELHVLRAPDGKLAGFFELDRTRSRNPYLSHMGLVDGFIGKGLGGGLLDAAIHRAWSEPCDKLRVNTCTADHPRALDVYIRAGFKPVRVVHETWDIPDDLGIAVPERLKTS